MSFFITTAFEQIDADIHQKHGTDQLEIGQGEQLNRHNGKQDPHHNGGGTAPENCFFLLFWLERACSHGDHHSVVTRQHDIRQND